MENFCVVLMMNYEIELEIELEKTKKIVNSENKK